MRAAFAISLIAAPGAVAPAVAQAPAPPTGNYGGGAVVAPPKSIYDAGNMLIGLRATADGRLEMNVAVILACSEDAVFRATFRPIDGTFGGHGTSTRRLPGRAEDHDRVEPPGAFMNGTTSQRLGGPRRAVTLRLSADGTKLERALYEVTVRCAGRSLTDIYDAPKRNLPIAADGTVSDVERFTFRNRSTILRNTERFEATLGQAGARGTFSITQRLASRRTGRTIETCRSGNVSFTAAT